MKRKAMSLIGLLLMVAVSTVEYTGGKGTFTFHDGDALTWSDSQEHVADGMTFTY